MDNNQTLQIKKTFTKVDYNDINLSGIEFDDCIFINCKFVKSDVSNTNFID